jgi:hypothetical protein
MVKTMDKRKLHDDLVMAFIEYQMRLDFPMAPVGGFTGSLGGNTRTSSGTQRYRYEAMFRCKVDLLVSQVMHLVDRHS